MTGRTGAVRKIDRHWHSPNHGARRDGLGPTLIVLHYTAMASAEAAAERLCAPEHVVSAHYLIGRDGALHALVEEDRRAWHAGAGAWRGQDDINSRSLGIELDNDGKVPFAAPLMDRLEALLADLMARWRIAPQNVIAHSDIAPLRKVDPGRRFDWRRLALAGLSVWPDVPGDAASSGPQGPSSAAAFGAALDAIGYPACEAEARLDAFRQRFRPMAHGSLTGADLAAARDLARRFAVDAAVPRT